MLKKYISPASLLLIANLILISCICESLPAISEPISVASTDTPTGSVILTKTPAPPPTEVPIPTSLNESGPYVIFKGSSGVWITNPDGSFPTRIVEYEIDDDLRRAISPTGERMAFVVRAEGGYDLIIIKIPSGDTESKIRLIDISPEEEIIVDPDADNAKAFTALAIKDYDNIAWEPVEGRYFAFVGAISGPTADLYLFDAHTQEITQLTDESSQAISPIWSPDGQHILHYGVSWVPPFGGVIGRANRVDGFWVVEVSSGQKGTLPKPNNVFINFVAWYDDLHYIAYDSDEECYSDHLSTVGLKSGELSPIMPYSFYYEVAQSPVNGALLFSSAAGCESSLGEGLFILLPGQSTPKKILEKRAYEINWMPESQVFQAYPEALFTPDGGTRYDPPVYEHSYNPAISKNGYQAWEVIENQQGRVMVRVPESNWRTILHGSVEHLIWDPVNGDILLIALQDGSLYAATYPDFSPVLMGNLGGRIGQAIWLP